MSAVQLTRASCIWRIRDAGRTKKYPRTHTKRRFRFVIKCKFSSIAESTEEERSIESLVAKNSEAQDGCREELGYEAFFVLFIFLARICGIRRTIARGRDRVEEGWLARISFENIDSRRRRRWRSDGGTRSAIFPVPAAFRPLLRLPRLNVRRRRLTRLCRGSRNPLSLCRTTVLSRREPGLIFRLMSFRDHIVICTICTVLLVLQFFFSLKGNTSFYKMRPYTEKKNCLKN